MMDYNECRHDIAASPIMPLDNPFAIAGFLGESNVADCDIDDSNEIEQDNNKEWNNKQNKFLI